MFTFDYFQPDNYRFSLDSILLAKHVSEEVSKIINKESKLLDLCSGCGVIGLEMLFYLPELNHVDFIEIQEVYLPYFDKNCQGIISKLGEKNLNLLNINYEQILSDKKFWEAYDIIVCNPPYFFANEGLLSPDNFKNRCRFFLDSSFDVLIKSICYALKDGGQSYILMTTGRDHKRSPLLLIQQVINSFTSDFDFKIEIFMELRNIYIIKITKTIKGDLK